MHFLAYDWGNPLWGTMTPQTVLSTRSTCFLRLGQSSVGDNDHGTVVDVDALANPYDWGNPLWGTMTWSGACTRRSSRCLRLGQSSVGDNDLTHLYTFPNLLF